MRNSYETMNLRFATPNPIQVEMIESQGRMRSTYVVKLYPPRRKGGGSPSSPGQWGR